MPGMGADDAAGPAAAERVSGGPTDVCKVVALKDVKVRSAAAVKVVGDEDSYAVSPRAPLLSTDLLNNAHICGEARFGQLGTGTRPVSHHRSVPTPAPQAVSGDNSWAAISLGNFHVAAITSQGKLYAWGLNSKGQCGVVEPDPADRGRITYYPGPARVKSSTTGGTYKLVACGGEHTVALGSRGLCAWGNNSRGQLGVGVGANGVVWRPMLVPGLSRTSITQLVCGAQHSLALSAQSQVFAWGANDVGQLGVGDQVDRPVPTPVEGLWGLPITRLAAGDAHSLALTTTGLLFAWGSNNHGQCGVLPENVEEPLGSEDDSVDESCTSSPVAAEVETEAPVQAPPASVTPPPMIDPAVRDQWCAAIIGMGVSSEVADMCLHITGYRGVEVAVDWLFSQDDQEVAGRLERWRLMQKLQGRGAQPPSRQQSPEPANQADVVEGAQAGDRAGRSPGPRSRLARSAMPPDGESKAHVPEEVTETTFTPQGTVLVVPTEVHLQGVRFMAAGMCFSVAVLEQGDVLSWGLGAWGALGHGDLQDQPLPAWIEALDGMPVERVSCGQYHTTFFARDGSLYGCGRYESGQLGAVSPEASSAKGLVDGGSGIVCTPLQLQLPGVLLDQYAAAAKGQSFQNNSPAANISSNSCSDGLSDTDADKGVLARAGLAPPTPPAVAEHVQQGGDDGAGSEGEILSAGLTPSPCTTIQYGGPGASPAPARPCVVLHDVVAGGCNTAILLRKQQEAPSPWQVTLLAKLQAAVARALALQNSGNGPNAVLAMALRNVARGTSLVFSSPAALCAALAVRPRMTTSPSLSLFDTAAIPGAVRTPTALQGGNPIFGTATSMLGSPSKRVPGQRAAASPQRLGSPGRSPRLNPAVSTGSSILAPSPLPLPLDVQLLDQLYCNLMELAGVSKDPALLGALSSTEGDQGPAMCELQRYSLQQALLRCGLTLCEDMMVHAPMLRTPERAQVLLAALHCPLLADYACCKQLLPKLCHAVLAAPAAARRLLVRWWASYPPDLLLERLVQPMQAFITKELAAVKKLTSSIMAVIKVLARVEAANQLAGGPLPPDAFYNTLISEKMDVQDHYSAWRTTQDLGGGLPGVRPVTNTSGAQYYACEPDSDGEGQRGPSRARTSHGGAATRTRPPTQTLGPTGPRSASGGAADPPASQQSDFPASDLPGWEPDGLDLASHGSMRMSDPGRRTTTSNAPLPILNNTMAQAQGSAPARRTTFTGSTTELQRRQQVSDAAIAHRTTVDVANAARAQQAAAWPEAQNGNGLPPMAPSSQRTADRRRPPGLPPRVGGAAQLANSQNGATMSQSSSVSGAAAVWEDTSAAAQPHPPSSATSNPAPSSRPASGASRQGETRSRRDRPSDPARPQPEPGPFSFCTYPFLLDARAKSNLLHVEARFQMEQTVAHARMEQQLYGQNVRFGEGGGSGRSRQSVSENGATGSTWAGEDLMLHVLDKTAAAEDQEDEDIAYGWPRNSSAPGAPGGSGASSGNGRERRAARRSRSKGFRGLLASLLRHGVSRGGSAPESEEEPQAVEGRAESFQLPRPRDCTMPGTHSDMCILRVRRTHLVEDALDEITRQTRRDLFKPLRVHFIGEEGIDAGGVKKEFFTLLLAELLRPEFGLMEVQPDSNSYWFPVYSMCSPTQYQLLGLVLGLAVYNRVLLDFQLPMAAYKKLLGLPVGLRDLQELSPPLGNSLKQLLAIEGPPGTVEDLLCLTWAVEHQAWGSRKVVELVPGGEQLPVNEDNREQYVDAMVDYHLNQSIKWQFEAFSSGFGVLCNGPALRLFNAAELERLVCGNPMLDFGALQRNAKYDSGYTANSPVVGWLWDLVRNELPLDEKKRFLKFFTGSDRSPIGGLGTLRCLIQRAGPDSDRLPTSHTCFNTLLLPEYTSRAKLARLLRTAINNAEGFGLQ